MATTSRRSRRPSSACTGVGSWWGSGSRPWIGSAAGGGRWAGGAPGPPGVGLGARFSRGGGAGGAPTHNRKRVGRGKGEDFGGARLFKKKKRQQGNLSVVA